MKQHLIRMFSGLPLAALWLTACIASLLLTGCVSQAQTEVRAPVQLSPVQSLPEAWKPLGLRLEADGLYGADIDAALRRLDPPTQDPMGRKIQELYRIKFPPPPPPPPPPGTEKKERVYVYPKVVTAENAAACRAFIAANEAAFARAEQRYGVPRDIAASLLFVETRLGQSPGKNNVFYTLASMASSRAPGQIPLWLEKLDQPEPHLDWIGETMVKRSDWAYKELSAFIVYARANNIDLLSVPGSVYGAMGICQFMPSSIDKFAADGNDDSVINLFVVDDAVASLSNYLVLNGWKPDGSRKVRHAALKRYNRLDIYANTILCLADVVRGEAVGRPVLIAPKKSQTSKTSSKQTQTKKNAQKNQAQKSSTAKTSPSKTVPPKK